MADIREKVREDTARIRDDLGKLEEVYRKDTGCWQGAAADEEICFVSSDIDELRQMLDDLDKRTLER